MTASELVVIRTFVNTIEADVARSALEAAGIDSLVRADDAGGVYPGLWMSNGVALLVRREDATRAGEILK